MRRRNKMNYKKIGGVASIYGGLSYIFAIIFYLVILKFHTLTNLNDKIMLFIEKRELIYILTLLSYTVFGFAMIILSLILNKKLKGVSKLSADFMTIIGIIWATVIIISAMIYNIGIDTVIKIYATNPDKAVLIWQSVETVYNGIGGGTEILGGLWMLIICFTAMKGNIFPKFLNILGIICGVAGVLSDLPMLRDLVEIFALTQIVWFIFLGVLLIKDKE
jgi:hypothetical protein